MVQILQPQVAPQPEATTPASRADPRREYTYEPLRQAYDRPTAGLQSPKGAEIAQRHAAR